MYSREITGHDDPGWQWLRDSLGSRLCSKRGAMACTFPFLIEISDRAFDAEATAIICKAFDKTCKELHDRGQPDSVREIIARQIIEIAGRGERDPDNLCEATLISLGFRRDLPGRFVA
jgi:hypothetical protein